MLFYKNNDLKKSKNWILPKALVHAFGENIKNFPSFFFLRKIAQENVFDDSIEGKKPFWDDKNKDFKKSKNWDFSKLISPWF